MKSFIFVLVSLISVSAFAQDYDCTLSLTKKGQSEVVIKTMKLPVDGFGERVSIPYEDVLDVRLFDENGELGVRLASMTGFPYPGSQPGRVIEQIRAESIYPADSKKILVYLQVPKPTIGANTYTLKCIL